MELTTAPGGTPGKDSRTNGSSSGIPPANSGEEPGGEIPDASWPMQLAGPPASPKATPAVPSVRPATKPAASSAAGTRRGLLKLQPIVVAFDMVLAPRVVGLRPMGRS